MIVWVLFHDDRMYDMGDAYIRGVYADEVTARDAIVTRTASGERSRSWRAHGEYCCDAYEYEVLTVPRIDVAEHQIPEHQIPETTQGAALVRDDLVDTLMDNFAKEFPL